MVQKPNAAQIAIAFCRAQIGDWYLWGAMGPDRWDCSGLMVKAFLEAGIILPRTTGMMINVGTPVAKADLRPGDLVFPDYHHVQIYSGGGRIIEAPQSGEQVVERNMWGFWRARRVITGTQGISAGDIIIGGATGPLGGQVIPGTGAAADAVDSLSAFAGVFQWLTNPNNWLRIGELISGVLLILVALLGMSGVRTIAKGAVNAGVT